MLAKAFLSLTSYPAFRRVIWKPVYENLAKHFQINDWHFMNYGYAPGETIPDLVLLPQDEINRYPIQLYHYMAAKTEIKDITTSQHNNTHTQTGGLLTLLTPL